VAPVTAAASAAAPRANPLLDITLHIPFTMDQKIETTDHTLPHRSLTHLSEIV